VPNPQQPELRRNELGGATPHESRDVQIGADGGPGGGNAHGTDKGDKGGGEGGGVPPGNASPFPS
jgi:hypothetical protein